MGMSLKNRLDGNKEEFLKDVERFGDFEAMERWNKRLNGYHDYIGLRKFILEETGNENFGHAGKLTNYRMHGSESLLRELVAAFADYVVRTRTQNEILRRRLEAYEQEGKNVEINLSDDLVGLLEEIKRI